MSPDEHIPGPLPEEWLPTAVPPEEDTAYWESQLGRVVDAAVPKLAARRRPRHTGAGWLEALAGWWHPAAAGALALSAAAVVAMLMRTPSVPRSGPAAVTLAAIVSGGEPAVLWSGAGAPVDPTLALIALEGGPPVEDTER